MLNRTWKSLTLVCVLVLGLSALAGCTPSAPVAPTAAPAAKSQPAAAAQPAQPAAAQPTKPAAPAQPKRGGTLIVGHYNKVSVNLDPQLGDVPDAPIDEQFYDRLVEFNGKLEVVPSLAEKWEIAQDLKTYTFYLRKGVKFHDGHELTSADVTYTFDRIIKSGLPISGRSRFLVVDAIDAPDPYIVVFKLKQASAALLNNLTMGPSSILPKDGGDELKTKPNGTGPFRLEEWVPDSHITMVRNPNYWRSGLPYLDKLTIKFILDEPTRVAQARAGNLDITALQDPKMVKSLENTPGVKLNLTPSQDITQAILFNANTKPQDDVRVRQAMSMAIDRKAIIDAVTLGLGAPTGPFPPGEPQWYLPPTEFPTLQFNLAKAKQLMAEAGVANGFKTSITVPSNNPVRIAAAQVIQTQWKQINIDVEIKPVEYATNLQLLRTKNFDLNSQIYWGRPDPDGYTGERYMSKSPSNYTNLSDPTIDDLVAKGLAAPTYQARKQIYDQLQRKVAEFVPWIWLYSMPNPEAVKDYVKGYTPMPNRAWFFFREIWLDK